MYKIKQMPEDFIVNEIFKPELQANGDYIYIKLTKKNYNTIDALKSIGKTINLPLKNLGFAGAKDRTAVTSQIISIKTTDNEKISKLKQLLFLF